MGVVSAQIVRKLPLLVHGIKMPPLERASLSGEDSWSNESDECCHSDPRHLSSKSLVLTSDYHLRTECLTDDDWTSDYSLKLQLLSVLYDYGSVSDYIFLRVLISE